jgi:RNA polymerase sigma-70 factor (ECF subfamily)
MPPFTGWYQGTEDIISLIVHNCPAKKPRDLKMIRTEANGQAAAGQYLLDAETGEYRAFSLHVLTLSGAVVTHVAMFFDLSLFETFELPMVCRG